MSEHRRKSPQSGGGGRAAARRGTSATPPGRRSAPRGSGTPSDSYDSYGSPSEGAGGEPPYQGRAAARRAAQRGGRRRAPDGGGRGGHGGRGHRGGGPGGPGGPGRGGPPPKKRFIDYPRAGKYGWGRWVPSWRLVSGMFITFFGGILVAAGLAYAMVGVPNEATSAKAQNNVYYWADGSEMVATGGGANRQIIKYEDIPEAMRWAVISAENKTFWTDKGVDPMGITRAFVNMAKGGETQGGSTITQQYVKNARLDDQAQTFTRKFKELFISIKVGAQVPKTEILSGYLNTAYYGRGAYGIQAAAHAYFNTDASKLNPSQCAFLAALLKGATYYDPAGNTNYDPAATPQANRARAEQRWSWILDQEVKYDHMTATERAKWTKFPEVKDPHSNGQLGGQIGYLVDLANGYAVNTANIPESNLQRGGYQIYTTFDKKKVDELKNSVDKVRKSKIDPKKRPDTDTHVQFGGASVDPSTGAIEAIYGGEDATKHFTNNADQTGAQVGSTWKPFVLAAALRDGVRDPKGPEDQGDDERTVLSPKSEFSGKNKLKIKQYDGSYWTDDKGKEWLQTNDGNESYGKKPDYKISLREAMQFSVNSPYVQLGMDVGLDKVKQAALDAGILDGSLASYGFPSFSIGTSDPSAIRMAGAYGTFAEHGQQRDPYSVKSIKHEGDVTYRHKDKVNQPFTPQVADNITDVLKNVVDHGTGTAAKLTGRDVAGKTGTTDGNKSAWFVGYTPQLSTAISMYRLDDNEKSKKREFLEMFGTGGEEKIHGASFPAQIWHDYMTEALAGTQPVPFTKPQPIGEVVGTPSPSPTPSDSASPSDTPTPSPTDSGPSGSPSPSDSGQSCGPWFPCDGGTGNGGATNGGTTNGGTTDGGTTTGNTGGTDTGGTNGGGNGANGGTDDGGLFGGPTGGRKP
ncbi:transglycosylase domain-containing protein [Streptomyces sp. TS71-3]|uniref:transglycosylase domain-containing protein n=1 Tax=Streptomyces sp. TS71-3 TaxID=2733862 RepID=UPI001B29B355|nr:transglycosylase domain-containing protein [Streptomyces sp. TS71-3]GHJ40237.1 penicillin-binding protein [Streptomyces sp. TS71-3]